MLSADSRQCYRELSIGTAKPSIEEQKGIPHFFIDSHQLTDEVSAAAYEAYAMQVLESAFQTNDVVVLVGGSGMFVDALCLGLDDIPVDREVKKSIIAQFEDEGLEPLLAELEQSDPVYFNEVDKANAPRIQRAIEAIRITGKPYSILRSGRLKNRPFTTHRYVLDHDREALYARINKRVDLMMDAGLEDEARSALQFRALSSMNTVGYKELFSYFDAEITRDEAINLIKQNSRRYAKRQLTWLRRHPDSHWIEFTTSSMVVQEILTNFELRKL